jgi:hypothetical protein
MMNAKLNSPYLRDIKIIRKGSGNIRSKIAVWGRAMARSRLSSPIMNRKMKKRSEDLKSRTKAVTAKKFKL